MKHVWTFVIFSMLMVTSLANAIDMDHIDCELSLQQILENNNSCVKEINGNKIYIKSDRISISENGMYVVLNATGDMALIRNLHNDGTGCYIQVNLRSPDQSSNYKRKCPKCGCGYFAFCRNPDCPTNK